MFKFKKIYGTTGWNSLIFGMEHPWYMEIDVCSNKVLGVINGPDQGYKLDIKCFKIVFS